MEHYWPKYALLSWLNKPVCIDFIVAQERALCVNSMQALRHQRGQDNTHALETMAWNFVEFFCCEEWIVKAEVFKKNHTFCTINKQKTNLTICAAKSFMIPCFK